MKLFSGLFILILSLIGNFSFAEMRDAKLATENLSLELRALKGFVNPAGVSQNLKTGVTQQIQMASQLTSCLTTANTLEACQQQFGTMAGQFGQLDYALQQNSASGNYVIGHLNRVRASYNELTKQMNKIATPVIVRSGVGCNDFTCIWVLGHNLTKGDVKLEVKRISDDQVVGVFKGNTLVKDEYVVVDNVVYQRLTVQLKGPTLEPLQVEEQVKITVVSAINERSNSDVVEADASMMNAVLDRSGSGCDDKQCVWAIGWNITKGNVKLEVTRTYDNYLLGTYSGNELVKQDGVVVDGKVYSSISARLTGLALDEFINEEKVGITLVKPNGRRSNMQVVNR